MALKRTRRLLLASFVGVGLFAAMLTTVRAPGGQLMGRILDGDEFLRLQVEADFDRDGDTDFLDFTVFSAFYEEE